MFLTRSVRNLQIHSFLQRRKMSCPITCNMLMPQVGLQATSCDPYHPASITFCLRLLHVPLFLFSIHKKNGRICDECVRLQAKRLTFSEEWCSCLDAGGRSSASVIPAWLHSVPKVSPALKRTHISGLTPTSE